MALNAFGLVYLTGTKQWALASINGGCYASSWLLDQYIRTGHLPRQGGTYKETCSSDFSALIIRESHVRMVFANPKDPIGHMVIVGTLDYIFQQCVKDGKFN